MALTRLRKIRHRITRIATDAKRRRQANKAIRFLHTQSRKQTRICPHGIPWQGHCAHTVACAYGRSASGWDAYAGWEQTLERFRHSGRNMQRPPRGALVFWRGGDVGHVAIALGDPDGSTLTNDAPKPRYIGTVPMRWYQNHWGNLTLVGWAFPDEVWP